ncbi:amino acid permease, partial [Enterococcus hirae]|nr:amino acid permease [Enterococcus hirae]
LTLLFLAIVLIFMFINQETRIPLIIGLVFLCYMTIHYFLRERRLKSR